MIDDKDIEMLQFSTRYSLTVELIYRARIAILSQGNQNM